MHQPGFATWAADERLACALFFALLCRQAAWSLSLALSSLAHLLDFINNSNGIYNEREKETSDSLKASYWLRRYDRPKCIVIACESSKLQKIVLSVAVIDLRGVGKDLMVFLGENVPFDYSKLGRSPFLVAIASSWISFVFTRFELLSHIQPIG